MSGTSGSIPTISSFTAGDIVVGVVGGADANMVGTTSGGVAVAEDNAASPITLEELNPTTGAIIGQLVLPQTASGANDPISGEYGSSSEGTLRLAGNGQSLVIAGYGINATTFNQGGAAVYGDPRLAQSTSLTSQTKYTPVSRVVADISFNGTVDTSTALFNVYNVNNPRSVATIDGAVFYLGGQGNKDATQGVFEATDGASSATAIDTASDVRDVEIYNDSLYISVDSNIGPTDGIASFGGLPTGAATPTFLNGLQTSVVLTAATANGVDTSAIGTSVNLSPENYVFADPTTLYVADGGAPKAGGLGDGGLQKWTLNTATGVWSLDYTLSAGLPLSPNTAADGTTGLIGLTDTLNANGTITLFATTAGKADLDQTYVVSITDTVANTILPTNETFTTLLTENPGFASTAVISGNTESNVRGIAAAPSAPTSTTIAAGQSTAAGTTVGNGSVLTILAGGTAAAVVVNSAGLLFVDSGAVDTGSLIATGGTALIGGSVAGDTVFGLQAVSGGTALGDVVSYGGLLVDYAGGSAGDTAIDGGELLISGATASTLVIAGGSVIAQGAGTQIDGGILFAGGGTLNMETDNGLGGIAGTIAGFAGADIIDLPFIGAGATLNSANSGGNTELTVTSGAVSESFILSGTYISNSLALAADANGGVEITVTPQSLAGTVAAGMVAPDVTVISTLTVAAGGTAISATVQSGATAVISGFDLASTVAAGGSEIIYGSANGDIVSGIQNISSGAATGNGSVTNESVGSGGQIDLFIKGGVATSTFVGSAGAIYISGNATASNTVLSGGSIVLESGSANITGNVVFDGAGTILYTSKFIATGDLAVLSGFGVNDAISLTSAAIGANAALSTVTSGGNTVATVTGTSGSDSFIFAGSGVALSLVSGAGGVEIVSGAASGTMSSGTGSSGSGALIISSGATATTIVASGQTLSVLAGGTELKGTILSGGSAIIAGTDSGTLIAAGGLQTVTNLAFGDQVSGVQALTNAAAVVTGETVFSGGAVDVLTAGAIANSLTVLGGGSLFIDGRGFAANTVLEGGTIILDSPKASTSGSLNFANTGAVIIEVATSASTASSGLGAVISNFDAADVIDIAAFGLSGSVLSSSIVGGNTVVTVSSGTGTQSTETLIFAGTNAGTFELVADANGGADLTVLVTTITGAVNVASGAALVDFIVASGGVVTVASAGNTSNGIVSSGAVILSGGTDAHTTITQGGSEILTGRGAVTINDTVYSGGTVILSSGATTSNITLSGGRLIAGAATAQDPTTVGSGSTDTVSGAGATATGTIIQPGGTEILAAGAVESAGSDAGLLLLSSGGTASGEIVSAGGVVSGLTGGVLISGMILSGATTTISGTDSGTMIGAGGSEQLFGTANGDVIGGTLNVGNSTISTGLVTNASVLSGGTLSLTIKNTSAVNTIVNSGGMALLNGNISGTNTTINGGTVVLQSPKATLNGDILFTGTGGLLDVTSQSSATYGNVAVISGFTVGDGAEAGFITYAGATLSAKVSGGNTTETITGTGGSESFTFSGTYGPSVFSLVNAGGFAEITANPCYCTGTRILGLKGEIAVEDIIVGDQLVTVRDGGPLCARVIWTGRRHLDLHRRPDAAALRPIRIAAGAIAPGLPERDLRVSPNHALYLDGRLFEAQALVNGVTITRDLTVRFVTYHHVELEAHDIILAEGLPAESYLDTGNRDAFEGDGATALFPDFGKPEAAPTCAPLVREGAALRAMQAHLAHRAGRQAA